MKPKQLPTAKPCKLCWWCEHFLYSSAGIGYSDLTPGYDMTMECSKSYWEFDMYRTSQEQLANMLQSAETCTDFKSTAVKGKQ